MSNPPKISTVFDQNAGERILTVNVPGEDNFLVACRCCCRITDQLSSDALRMPTLTELLRAFGRTCGRCGENTLGNNAVWPTLPCLGSDGFSTLLGDAAFSPPGPAARFTRVRACLRFLVRIIDIVPFPSEDVLDTPEDQLDRRLFGVIDEQEFGGTSARTHLSAVQEAIPYRQDKPFLFSGEQCGMYIYVIEFFKWTSRCTCWDFVLGGAQPQTCVEGVPNDDCVKLHVYLQDMFKVARFGPFFTWPPYFEDDCEPVFPDMLPPS
jgi:hypothetical protein